MSKTTRLAGLLGENTLSSNVAQREAERLKLERERVRAAALNQALQTMIQGGAQGLSAAGQMANDYAERQEKEKLKLQDALGSSLLAEPEKLLSKTPELSTETENKMDEAEGPLLESQMITVSPVEKRFQEIRNNPRFEGFSDEEIRGVLGKAKTAAEQYDLDRRFKEAQISKFQSQAMGKPMKLKERIEQFRSLGTGVLDRIDQLTKGKSVDERTAIILEQVQKATGDIDPDQAVSVYYTVLRERNAQDLKALAQHKQLNPDKPFAPDPVSKELLEDRRTIDAFQAAAQYIAKNKDKIEFDKLQRLQLLSNQIGLPSIPSTATTVGGNINFNAGVSAGLGVQGGYGEGGMKGESLGSYNIGDERAVQLQNELANLSPETREFVATLQILNRYKARAIENGLLTNLDWQFFQNYLANPFTNDPKALELRLNNMFQEMGNNYVGRIKEYGYKYDLNPQHLEWAQWYANQETPLFQISGNKVEWNNQVNPPVSNLGLPQSLQKKASENKTEVAPEKQVDVPTIGSNVPESETPTEPGFQQGVKSAIKNVAKTTGITKVIDLVEQNAVPFIKENLLPGEAKFFMKNDKEPSIVYTVPQSQVQNVRRSSGLRFLNNEEIKKLKEEGAIQGTNSPLEQAGEKLREKSKFTPVEGNRREELQKKLNVPSQKTSNPAGELREPQRLEYKIMFNPEGEMVRVLASDVEARKRDGFTLYRQ